MKSAGYPLSLAEVFRLALEAVSAGRLIFGTDSTHFPRGFRGDILDVQRAALQALAVLQADVQRI